MDRLEKYIGENRPSFDDKIPSSEVWHRINDQLDQEKAPVLSIGAYVWRAAAIILFAAVVWLLVDRNGDNELSTQTQALSDEDQIEFTEVEAFYFREIQEKQNIIMQFVANNPEMNRDLMGDIDQLDSTYQELKAKIQDGYSEKILDAMVLNLQMRIDILNLQLEVLEKIKNIQENEKVNI